MHIGILFYNIGGYHAARLRAVQAACEQRGWNLTAIQVTDQTGEHPWGVSDRAGLPARDELALRPARLDHALDVGA